MKQSSLTDIDHLISGFADRDRNLINPDTKGTNNIFFIIDEFSFSVLRPWAS